MFSSGLGASAVRKELETETAMVRLAKKVTGNRAMKFQATETAQGSKPREPLMARPVPLAVPATRS
jgi:hypothetical protein